MEDARIVELYFLRDEAALAETKKKYGRYLQKISYNILGDVRDCEEALSDVCLGAWNSIPPNAPKDLKSYLSKLARRVSIDALRRRERKKRASEFTVSLGELCDCLPDSATPENECDLRLLCEVIESWLSGLNEQQRAVFILRYFYAEPIAEISKKLGFGKEKTKSMLFRLRESLKSRLEKEEFI